jgi:hypothetical protein
VIAGLCDNKNGLKAACVDGKFMLCFGYKSVQSLAILENNIFAE